MSQIELYLPYITLSKKDVIKDGLEACKNLNLDYKVVYRNTITTYSPDKEGYSKGNTGSDIERVLAFKALNIEDPGLYTVSWDELVNKAVKLERNYKENN